MADGAISWLDVEYCQLSTPTLNGNSGTSALSFDAAYPAANAVLDDPSLVAQVDYTRNGTPNLDITVSCVFSASNNKTIRVLAAINVRLPSDVVQVTAVAKNLAGSVLETATTFTAAQLILQPRKTDRYDLFWILSADQVGARADFNFRFPASTSGYFEIGRLWAGAGLVWPQGVGVDWSMSGVDASRIARGDGGGFSSYRYPVRKTLSISKRGLSYIDALGDPDDALSLSFRQCLLEAGSGTPMIVISTNADQHKAQVQSVYGAADSVASLDHAGAQRYGTGMVVQQIR